MEDKYQNIEKYVNGDLSGQELVDFEKRLEEDDSLAEEVKLFRQVKESISDQLVHEQDEESLKGTLTEIGSQFFEEKKKEATIRPLFRRFLLPATGIAAAILLLIIVRPFQGSLYNQFGQMPTAAFIEQGNAQEANLLQAQQAFNQKDYQAAKDVFQQYLTRESNKDDVEIQFFLGLSHLELEEYAQAESIFQSLHEGNSAYKNEGTWYLALNFLKQKNRVKCREYLELIPEATSHYDEAQILLRKIRNKN